MINAQIFHDDFLNRDYYTLCNNKYSSQTDVIKYDILFPLQLAIKAYRYNRGPESCSNCLNYGLFNGLLVTLCSNCIKEINESEKYLCLCNTGCDIEETINNLEFPKYGCKENKKDNCIFYGYLSDLPIFPIHKINKYHSTSSSILSKNEHKGLTIETDFSNEADWGSSSIKEKKNEKGVIIPEKQYSQSKHLISCDENGFPNDINDILSTSNSTIESIKSLDEYFSSSSSDCYSLSDEKINYILNSKINYENRRQKLLSSELWGRDLEEYEKYLEGKEEKEDEKTNFI